MPEQAWGTVTLQLTLLTHAAFRQDQVINGHSPPTASHALNQHLQGSTTPAASTGGLAQDGRAWQWHWVWQGQRGAV